MKKTIFYFAVIIFISCKGGSTGNPGSGTEDSMPGSGDTVKTRNDKKIDTAAAALPTDTAPYKRKPGDTVIRP